MDRRENKLDRRDPSETGSGEGTKVEGQGDPAEADSKSEQPGLEWKRVQKFPFQDKLAATIREVLGVAKAQLEVERKKLEQLQRGDG